MEKIIKFDVEINTINIKVKLTDQEKNVLLIINENNEITFNTHEELKSYEPAIMTLYNENIITPYFESNSKISYILTDYGINITKSISDL